MAKDWAGRSYDEGWNEVDNTGAPTGGHADQSTQQSWYAANPAFGPQQPSSSTQKSSWQTAAPTSSPWGQGVRDKLTSEMNTSPMVDTNAPEFRQAVESNQFAAQRGAERQRAATAQRMAAQGTLSGGGLDTAVQRITGDQGAQEQAFEANLMNQYRQQNLDRAGRGLQLSTGLLGQDEQRALQQLLTQQGYDLQREGYDLQRDLSRNQLDYQRDALAQQLGLGEAGLNQQAMLALLGR